MVSYAVLNEQNHRITELSNVLAYLIQDRAMCDSRTCCDLFFNYMENVQNHMKLVDSNLYGELLNHPSNEINNTAKNFMSGSQEIRRIVKRYNKKWCDKKSHDLSIGKQYAKFLVESDQMFSIVLDRIQDETEHLYPLSRRIKKD